MSENGQIYVRFGPLKTQEMPVEWAEEMLRIWREKDPGRFGKILSEVVAGAPPKGR